MTSKEFPSVRSRVLPFQERDRRTGRHDGANQSFFATDLKMRLKLCGIFTDISMVIETHRTFTVSDNRLWSVRRLELRINSSIRRARKPSPRHEQCIDLTLRLLMSYTGWNRRNGPDFGRVFLMLEYSDITQNTYIQS